MVDLTTGTIRDLFYQQIKNQTIRTLDSFDMQFSDQILKLAKR